MLEIIDLGMYDHEYLQFIAQGRDPVQEKICALNLIQIRVSPEEAYLVAPLLKKSKLSTDEEALVRKIWQRVRS